MQSITPKRCKRTPGGRTAALAATPARIGESVSATRGNGCTGAPLGIDAKYSAVCQETGEITEVSIPGNTKSQRFILQSVVRKLLPKSRTNNCLRVRQGNKQIQVWKSIEHGSASFSGLQTCGSVWSCPVCAAKIAERRRAEILVAMTSNKAQGGLVNMLTLTCPHQRSDDLVELLAKQAKALKAMFSDWTVKAIFKAMGIVGQIKATEVTHGRLSPFDNGWHPHYHLLLFSGSNVALSLFDAPQMEDWQVRLYLRWAACCVKAGLGEPSYAHGLKLDNGDKAAKYVSKWGLEDEMTKGHIKKALHGETPFDFLRALVASDDDRQAAVLFIEFANAFKGKRQLHWSKGLKKMFAIGEKTDDELVEEKDDFAEVLGHLTIEQWRDVLAVEGRGNVLALAVSGGWSAVSSYLFSIKGKGVPKKSTKITI